MWWEGVSLETEGADPEFSSDIDLAGELASTLGILMGKVLLISIGQRVYAPVRVENRLAARFTSHRLVQYRRQIVSFLEGGVEGRDGNDSPSSFDP